ncbi:PLP-dependent aminotransferase family protein [Gemmatimonas groenlandica]|uniref:aminotransferase-like domain-containing protein n=1 Tax=Gemmatimonas groenlandica TaxID=2732249 RepID=UPI00148782EA|nr:PLP-dependent aminotransferase family protein [Gemmatimonas groenlandica]
MATALHTDIIDFGKGQPSLSLLPLAAWRAATDHCLAQGDAGLLQYGADEGDAGFRESLAQFLSRRYAMPVTAAELVVSAGASQALDLVCTRFTRPGDTIFVEAPTYFLALDIFRDHGLQVVGIPIDEDGIRVDALQDALVHHRAAFLYTVPSFQNPSGTTMSAARREQLMAVSRSHDLLIIADEVYQLLDFGSAPPPPLAAYVHTARVLSIGSFSKICAPGLRLGWLHGAPALLNTITQSGLVQSGGGLNPFVSGAMRSLIDLGLADTVLDGLRRVYAERSAVLCRAMRELLPAVTFVEPTGGYFVWAQLPAAQSAAELLPFARTGGVAFHPGTRFSSGGFGRHVRLSFAYYDAPELVEGVLRLAQVPFPSTRQTA